VLLVDEATASLDPVTAFGVTDAILSLDGLTRILVTHRLEEAMLRRCDGILVLKNGCLEEFGAFDELMDRKGYFYSFFINIRCIFLKMILNKTKKDLLPCTFIRIFFRMESCSPSLCPMD
jgi:ABC-type multidrug transport system ATPase subunit